MKKILTITALFASISLFVLVTVPSVSAAYTCGGVETTIDFGANSQLCTATGAGPVTAIMLWAINFLAIGVGIAVVIGIIFGGITYSMSDGDASKAKQGKDIITNAIIGLFLFLFLFAAANFLVPGGLFTSSATHDSVPTPTDTSTHTTVPGVTK